MPDSFGFDFNHVLLKNLMRKCKMALDLRCIFNAFFLPFFPSLSTSYLSSISTEGRPLPDGALHAAPGAHHADQRQRVRRRRLLLPTLHWQYPPPGGNALSPGAARDACGGGEGGGSGGWRGGAQLRVAAQQASRHPALGAQWPGDTR